MFGQVFFQVLDVATMSLLFMAMDCQYFSVPAEDRGYHLVRGRLRVVGERARLCTTLVCWCAGVCTRAGAPVPGLQVERHAAAHSRAAPERAKASGLPLPCSLPRPPPCHRRAQEFSEVYCWTMPHLLHVTVAAASLVVFVVLAWGMLMAEMELDLTSHSNLLAMHNTSVETNSFLVKFVMTGA